MAGKFKTVDYEATLEQVISLREAWPASHLARFVAGVVAELDLGLIYERYGSRGGEAYAPEVLLALLFYGYASGRLPQSLPHLVVQPCRRCSRRRPLSRAGRTVGR